MRLGGLGIDGGSPRTQHGHQDHERDEEAAENGGEAEPAYEERNSRQQRSDRQQVNPPGELADDVSRRPRSHSARRVRSPRFRDRRDVRVLCGKGSVGPPNDYRQQPRQHHPGRGQPAFIEPLVRELAFEVVPPTREAKEVLGVIGGHGRVAAVGLKRQPDRAPAEQCRDDERRYDGQPGGPVGSAEPLADSPGDEGRQGDGQRQPAVVLGRPGTGDDQSGDDCLAQPVSREGPPRTVDGEQEPEAQSRIGQAGARIDDLKIGECRQGGGRNSGDGPEPFPTDPPAERHGQRAQHQVGHDGGQRRLAQEKH